MVALLSNLVLGLCLLGADDEAAAEAFVAWAAEVAIPVDLNRGIDAETLAPLVEGKRFVYLGEPDHFIQEKYAFRLAFLRPLHELGWRHLGMEMGRSDGLRFDSYLESGDESRLLEVGLYSSTTSVAGAIEAGGFLGSEMAYARAVRAIADGPARLHYFGFDLDMAPGNGIEDARSRLADLGEEAELGLILDDVWSAEDRVEELAIFLAELEDPESGLAAPLSEERRRELRLDLLGLGESLHFQRAQADAAGDLTTLLEGFARRERTMFQLFDGYVESVPESEKIVLTGHNMHLGRSWEGASWIELGSFVSVPLWPTIGAHICGSSSPRVLAVWLVYDHGEHLAASDRLTPREVSSVDGTVESLLARLPHEALLLPLASDDPRSAWLDGDRTYRVNGGVGRGRLRELTDVLLFVREATLPHAKR